MGSLLVHILPIAVAIALEPICIMAALVMPATDRPLANSFAYLGALIGVMLGYGAAVLLVFQHRAVAGGTRTDDIVQLLWLLIGLGFLTAFAVLIVRRPLAGGVVKESRWTRWVAKMGPLGAAAVGVFLVNWEMETPALTVILKSRVQTPTALTALVVFTAVAVSTAVVPVAAYLAAPDQIGGVLATTKAWLSQHERMIVLILFGLIGAAFTYMGGAALLRQ
ncbi:MAG TPA: GAP family protein [Thermoleophilia bacterium]